MEPEPRQECLRSSASNLAVNLRILAASTVVTGSAPGSTCSHQKGRQEGTGRLGTPQSRPGIPFGLQLLQ